jgi:integrase-like protein
MSALAELLIRTSVLVGSGRSWSPFGGPVTARTAQRRPTIDLDLHEAGNHLAVAASRRACAALSGGARAVKAQRSAGRTALTARARSGGELLDDVPVWPDIDTAQAAIDAFRLDYNTDRPHQSLDMAFPADRFQAAEPPAVPVKLPATLTVPVEPPAPPTPVLLTAPPITEWSGSAVEFDRVVPPSGNLQVAGKQFWLGPNRSGVTVTFWADPDVIHLLIAGALVKTVSSHLSVADLAALRRQGGRPAGPPPMPPPQPGDVVEVDRTVNRFGTVSLGQRLVVAADILSGRRVSIRIDTTTLSFFDPETRRLLRTRPNPLIPDEVSKLRGLRRAGPPPIASPEPVRVQRRVSDTGVVMVARQTVALGRLHAGKTVAIEVTDTELVVACDDGPRIVRRTNTLPIRNLKANRPARQANEIKTQRQATAGTEPSSIRWD